MQIIAMSVATRFTGDPVEIPQALCDLRIMSLAICWSWNCNHFEFAIWASKIEATPLDKGIIRITDWVWGGVFDFQGRCQISDTEVSPNETPWVCSDNVGQALHLHTKLHAKVRNADSDQVPAPNRWFGSSRRTIYWNQSESYKIQHKKGWKLLDPPFVELLG